MRNMEKILCHLEFLGYENFNIDTSNIKSAVVKGGKVHPYNILVREITEFFIYIENYILIENIISPEMLAFINKLNLSCVSKFVLYADESNGKNKTTLKIQALYTGDYNKIIFAQLIDAFQKESLEMSNLDTDGVLK